MTRLKLGLWCEQANLRPEATVEFTAAVHDNPQLAEAWKHLGYVRYKGRWRTPAGIAAENAEAEVRAKPTNAGSGCSRRFGVQSPIPTPAPWRTPILRA